MERVDDDRQKEYFDQAKQWLEQQHGKQNVVATSIHRDETTPTWSLMLYHSTKKLTIERQNFLAAKRN